MSKTFLPCLLLPLLLGGAGYLAFGAPFGRPLHHEGAGCASSPEPRDPGAPGSVSQGPYMPDSPNPAEKYTPQPPMDRAPATRPPGFARHALGRPADPSAGLFGGAGACVASPRPGSPAILRI